MKEVLTQAWDNIFAYLVPKSKRDTSVCRCSSDKPTASISNMTHIMQIPSKWLLLSWGPGLAHSPQCLLVQLEHLHPPPDRWVSANWGNEAVSLWGWLVLNKQEQRGTVLHRASCGSILAPSAAVFTTLLAGAGMEKLLQKKDSSNSKHKRLAWKQARSASVQLPDVFFSAEPSEHDILYRICDDKNGDNLVCKSKFSQRAIISKNKGAIFYTH